MEEYTSNFDVFPIEDKRIKYPRCIVYGQAVLDSYLREFSEHYSSETLYSYRSSVHQFLAYCSKEINDITKNDVKSWIRKMNDLKANTINRNVCALKSFFAYCLEDEIIKTNPTLGIKYPKDNSHLPKSMSSHTLFKMREATKNNLRERAIIETLYYTGVRVSELINILIEDVNWENNEIWIRKGKGNKERIVLITPDCCERLKVYLNSRKDTNPYLFVNRYNNKMSRQIIARIIKSIVKAVKIDEKVTPHIFRHTFATDLAEKGAPIDLIADLLGHKNINNVRIYAHLTAKAKKRKYDEFGM